MFTFLDGVHPENSRNISPTEKISIYEFMNMPRIIREFSIKYDMTTPKSCHDVTTPMELSCICR